MKPSPRWRARESRLLQLEVANVALLKENQELRGELAEAGEVGGSLAEIDRSERKALARMRRRLEKGAARLVERQREVEEAAERLGDLERELRGDAEVARVEARVAREALLAIEEENQRLRETLQDASARAAWLGALDERHGALQEEHRELKALRRREREDRRRLEEQLARERQESRERREKWREATLSLGRCAQALQRGMEVQRPHPADGEADARRRIRRSAASLAMLGGDGGPPAPPGRPGRPGRRARVPKARSAKK